MKRVTRRVPIRSKKGLLKNNRFLKSSSDETFGYEQEVYDDLYNLVEEQYQEGNPIDYDTIYELAWGNDNVTGNGSDSYFYDGLKARNAVLNRHNGMELLREALSEFVVSDSEIAEKFLNEDWEHFDVRIRCYLLGQVLQEVLDDFESANNLSNSCRIRKKV